MSYADVASENFQLWNVNQKKIGVIRELVKKSKQVRLAIRVYFFGKWNRYANRRYLKLAFRGFKEKLGTINFVREVSENIHEERCDQWIRFTG